MMATIPGIYFEAVEPPNPYLDDRSWQWRPSLKRVRSNYAQTTVFPASMLAGGEPTGAPLATEPPASFPSRYQPKPENLQTRQALLPPFSVALAVSVTQGLAKAVVTQTFRNDAPDNIEKGTYQFPIPHESSVVDFKCQIGATKILQTQVKPKPEARDTFDKAVKEGQSAGLVEQDSPEIFRTELGNIPAHTTVEVKLSFIFSLKHTLSNNATTTVLTIPTYIAPRYGDPGFELRETGPLSDTKLSVNIDILTSTEIRDIRSDTHKVIVERGSRQRRCRRWADFVAGAPPLETTSASVRLDDGPACLDKDFILVVTAQPSVDEELPHATLESHPDAEGSSALMLEIPPSFMLRDETPMDDTEVVFLADRSGSMLDKIPGLKSSLEFFLRGLPKTRFNLYCFGSNYTSLWPASRPYNDDTLSEALRYVSHFTNDMGGTDLLPALQSLISSHRKGSLDVIVLTDGEAWRLQETIEFVRETHLESKGAVRFFSMGIGNAVSHELVEGIASAGGGYAEIIPLASSEGWEARMVAVLKAAMTGHVSGIGIEVDGIDIDYESDTDTSPTFQISPRDISNLSPFIRNRIFILAENKQLSAQSVVKIKRRSIGGYETATPVQLHVPEEQDSTLHKFAARALLSDLSRAKAWTQHGREGFQRPVRGDDLIRKEGERLGCRYSLVSKWTSFVAVEVTGSRTNEPASNKRDYATSISSDMTIAGLEPLDSEDMDLLCVRSSSGRQLPASSLFANSGASDYRVSIAGQAPPRKWLLGPKMQLAKTGVTSIYRGGSEAATVLHRKRLSVGESGSPWDSANPGRLGSRKASHKAEAYTPPLPQESQYTGLSYSIPDPGPIPTNGGSFDILDPSVIALDSASGGPCTTVSQPPTTPESPLSYSYASLGYGFEVENSYTPSQPAPATEGLSPYTFNSTSHTYDYVQQQCYSPLADPGFTIQHDEAFLPSVPATTYPDRRLSKAKKGRASHRKRPGRKALGTSFIYDVLKFQKSNGVFEIRRSLLEPILKFSVRGIVKDLQEKGLAYDLAVTAIIVVTLEHKLAQHRDLWVRMVEKAREYIQSQVENAKAVDTLLETAESMLKALDEEGSSQDKDTEDVKAEEAAATYEIQDEWSVLTDGGFEFDPVYETST